MSLFYVHLSDRAEERALRYALRETADVCAGRPMLSDKSTATVLNTQLMGAQVTGMPLSEIRI